MFFFMEKGKARETLMLHPRDHKGLYGRDMGKLIKKKKNEGGVSFGGRAITRALVIERENAGFNWAVSQPPAILEAQPLDFDRDLLQQCY